MNSYPVANEETLKDFKREEGQNRHPDLEDFSGIEGKIGLESSAHEEQAIPVSPNHICRDLGNSRNVKDRMNGRNIRKTEPSTSIMKLNQTTHPHIAGFAGR